MDGQTIEATQNSLVWLPQQGWGYYPCQSGLRPYGKAYFDKYAGYASTDMGRAITSFRVNLVNRFHAGTVLDVGVGAGAFVQARNESGNLTIGYDVNPHATQWLSERGWLADNAASECATFFDVLEHIPDPTRALARIGRTAVLTIPVFDGVDHVLNSHHFRPDEHYWYFTVDGLARFMGGHGFKLVLTSYQEKLLGRRDVGTFVFQRP